MSTFAIEMSDPWTHVEKYNIWSVGKTKITAMLDNYLSCDSLRIYIYIYIYI